MKQLALLALSGVIAAAAACSGGTAKKSPSDGEIPTGDNTGDPPLPPPRDPDIVNDDAGAFVGGRGKDGGATTTPDGGRGGADAAAAADSSDLPDASTPDSAIVADSGAVTPDSGGTVTPDSGIVGPANACPNGGALSAGDLAVVEVMIASQSGSGDRGEWLEVQSTRTCALNLNGLHVESPRGTLKDTFDVTIDTWLGPNGIFVLADSADSTKNHDLPVPIFVWNGAAADVLINSGDTITFTAGAVTVENFVYPAFQTVYVGRSLSFPVDCAWSDRSSWARWSWAFHAWSGTNLGTPNADNTDVACY